MPRLLLNADKFFSERPSSIRALLGTVAFDVAGLQIRMQKHSAGHIVAASDTFSVDDSPTDRLFATTSNELYGQYYEIWTSDKHGRNYYLYQNYFHLYALLSRIERDQLFCLHAEPEEPLDQMVGRLKASPHIHVKSKEDRLLPVGKAHLPVCYSTAEAVLKSITAFDAAFSETISVIRHEVVDRYD